MRHTRQSPSYPRTSAAAAALLAIGLLSPPLLLGQSQLKADLDVEATLADGTAVSVKFTLNNESGTDLEVLTWLTPLEGLAGEIFRVERDGEVVPYRGILAHRDVPAASEYVSIAAGGEVSAEVDLATSYDFSQAGDYTIEFLSPPVGQVVTKGSAKAKRLKALTAVQIPSEAVTTKILGASEPPASEEAAGDEAQAKTTSFNGCSAARQSTLGTSQNTALITSAFVVARLSSSSAAERAADVLYDTWFGNYTAARFSTVQNNLEDIHDYLTSENVSYDCTGTGCGASWNAYVYSGGAYEIFLCPNYWTKPDSGQVSKHSIIYHETSHEAAGTKDHTYGSTNCQNLANTDPNKAIENADSYEYYYANTPLGAEHLVFALPVLLVILLFEGFRRYRRHPSRQLGA